MWRTAVLLVAVVAEFAVADVKTGVNDAVLQRARRAPGYGSDCYYPPPPPRPYWPPPPPPPPPPYWHHRHHDDYRAYSLADAEANGQQNLPCTTCGGSNGASNAVSNANSETGKAIAIAIAKAQTSK